MRLMRPDHNTERKESILKIKRAAGECRGPEPGENLGWIIRREERARASPRLYYRATKSREFDNGQLPDYITRGMKRGVHERDTFASNYISITASVYYGYHIGDSIYTRPITCNLRHVRTSYSVVRLIMRLP